MRLSGFHAAAIVAIGVAACSAMAQSGSPPHIGYLDGGGSPERLAAFKRGLSELGYAENRTILIERRSAAGHAGRLQDLASELVRLQPRVIVGSSAPAGLALKQVTTTIPVVMINVNDPVGLGLAASLAHPGGNMTGLSNLSTGLGGKRLELLMEIVPGLSRVGIVWQPAMRTPQMAYRDIQAANAAARLAIESFEVARPEDIASAFSAARKRVDAVVVLNSPIIVENVEMVIAAAARQILPAIYYESTFAEMGGLISYGADIPDLHRRAAVYVDKILKGAKPGDLPIEEPSKLDLIVNLKTAKALGITIPQSILVRADEVIE